MKRTTCGGCAFETAQGAIYCASGPSGGVQRVGCGWSYQPERAARPTVARSDKPWFRLPTLDELTPGEVSELTPWEREQLHPPVPRPADDWDQYEPDREDW